MRLLPWEDFEKLEKSARAELVVDDPDAVARGLETVRAALDLVLSERWRDGVDYDISDGFFSHRHKVFCMSVHSPLPLCREFFEAIQTVAREHGDWAVNIASEPESDSASIPDPPWAILFVTGEWVACGVSSDEERDYYGTILECPYADRLCEMRSVGRRLWWKRFKERMADTLGGGLAWWGIWKPRIWVRGIPSFAKLADKRLFHNPDGDIVFQAKLRSESNKYEPMVVRADFFNRKGERVGHAQRDLGLSESTGALFNLGKENADAVRVEVTVLRGRLEEDGTHTRIPDKDFTSRGLGRRVGFCPLNVCANILPASAIFLGTAVPLAEAGVPERGRPMVAVGHGSGLAELAFDQQKQHVLTGGADGRALVWDLETGESIQILTGHQSGITSVDADAEFAMAITGSTDGTARVWDVSKGKEIRKLRHDAGVGSVAISADGKLAATLFQEVVRVWDLRSGERLQEFPGKLFGLAKGGMHIAVANVERNEVVVFGSKTREKLAAFPVDPNVRRIGQRSIAMSADGSVIAVGSGRAVEVFDLSGERILKRPTRRSDVRDVAVSVDGRRIVVTEEGGYPPRIWDTETGKRVSELDLAEGESVGSIAISPKGMRILGASNDGSIRRWAQRDGRELGRWKFGRKPDRPLALVAETGRLVAVSEEGGVFVRGWGRESVPRVLKGVTSTPNVAAFDPAGTKLAVGFSFEPAGIWDAESGALKTKLGGRAGDFSFDAKGGTLASGKMNLQNAGSLWDVGSGERLRAFSGGKLLNDTVVRVAMSGDGSRLLSGGGEAVTVWDTKTGETRHLLEGHGSFLSEIQVSGNGKVAVVISDRGPPPIIWDLESGERKGVLEREGFGVVRAVAISGDGGRIWGLSIDGKLGCWNSEGGFEKEFSGMHPGAHRLYLAAGGVVLWTLSIDGMVRLWNTEKGKELCRCFTFEGGKGWLALASDGRFDGSEDGLGLLRFRDVGGGLITADEAGKEPTPGLLRSLIAN